MTNSRTQNALKNSIITTICQILYLLSSFIGRTALTKILGAEYLGINGLFSNILTIISFAELGIGSALVYHMYKPLAEGDTKKLTAYIQLYKKIYGIIIAIVSICGIAIIPFLKYIVEAPKVKEELILLYILYLGDTIITYAYVYKKSILIADQKSYIISIFTQAFNIIMNIVQCIVLIITHSFIFYFAIRLICNLLNNITCSYYAQKHYPFISQKEYDKVDQMVINGLKKDAKGLLLDKFAGTAFGGTDNIFISTFIGIEAVGILSNYTMILSIINSLINNIFNSITASIGNLNATKTTEQTEKVLNRLWFINTCFYGYISIAMIILIREFITDIWFDEQYYLPMTVIIVAVTELFFRSIHFPLYTVRTSMGLFSEYKWIFAVSAILNILLDFILVKPLGITGLFLATILCEGITYIADIQVVYRIGFKKSPIFFYKNIVLWSGYLFVLCLLLISICNNISITGILGLVIRGLTITAVYIVSCIILFHKNENFIYFKSVSSKLIKKNFFR